MPLLTTFSTVSVRSYGINTNTAAPGPSGVGRYFYSTGNTDYFEINNWFTDSNHTQQAAELPNNTTNVVILSGSVIPFVNLDSVSWVSPASIDAGSVGITFTSQNNGSVACNITGNPITFEGNASYSVPVGVGFSVMNDTNNGTIYVASGSTPGVGVVVYKNATLTVAYSNAEYSYSGTTYYTDNNGQSSDTPAYVEFTVTNDSNGGKLYAAYGATITATTLLYKNKGLTVEYANDSFTYNSINYTTDNTGACVPPAYTVLTVTGDSNGGTLYISSSAAFGSGSVVYKNQARTVLYASGTFVIDGTTWYTDSEGTAMTALRKGTISNVNATTVTPTNCTISGYIDTNGYSKDKVTAIGYLGSISGSYSIQFPATITGDDIQALSASVDFTGCLSPDTDYYYTMSVSNPSGTTLASEEGMFHSPSPVSITTQPQGGMLDQNGQLAVSISYTGTAPVTVEWYDAATNTLIDQGDNITIYNAGSYFCRLTNIYTSTDSNTITVTEYQSQGGGGGGGGEPIIVNDTSLAVSVTGNNTSGWYRGFQLQGNKRGVSWDAIGFNRAQGFSLTAANNYTVSNQPYITYIPTTWYASVTINGQEYRTPTVNG